MDQMDKNKKVYIKYFLTAGILELDLISGPDPTEPEWIWCRSFEGDVRVKKPDWHISKSEAIARAREMIESRMVLVVRQVHKLIGLSKMTDVELWLYQRKGGTQ